MLQCQSLSASGIAAKAISKGEAMRSIYNHSVDCNVEHVQNNVHVCLYGSIHVPELIYQQVILYKSTSIREQVYYFYKGFIHLHKVL